MAFRVSQGDNVSSRSNVPLFIGGSAGPLLVFMLLLASVAGLGYLCFSSPLPSFGLAAGILFLLFVAASAGLEVLWRRHLRAFRREVMEADGERRAMTERFTHLYKHANDVIMLFDRQWRFVEVNDRCLQTYGYTIDELRGMTNRDLRAPEFRPSFPDMERQVEGGDGVVLETLHQRRDGSVLPVEASVRAVEIDGVRYYQAIVRDISERKRAEAALKESEETLRRLNAELEQRVRERTAELELANKELEAFSYSVSHDLRAPLRGIDGWSLALLEDCGDQLDETGREHLRRVRSESQRMAALIDDLLKLSRVVRAGMCCTAVDLSALAGLITARLLERHGERHVDLIIQPRLTAWADAALMEIALTNLLENAVKFTGPRERARIEFGWAGEPGAFFVRDNGVGFDAEHSDMLFTPFHRMHRPSQFPGTGIGLATVQRIVRRHGGRVWAESAEDRGATFFFTLAEAS
jgi:PAS domain S-box-containing protein